MFKDRITPDYRGIGDVAAGDYPSGDFHRLLRTLSDSIEYSELPVRHNEGELFYLGAWLTEQTNLVFDSDLMNMDLGKLLPISAVDSSDSNFGGGRTVFAKGRGFDDPNTKAFILLQAHLSRIRTLPCADYYTDTKSVLDQAIRIIQAMVDVAADQGYLSTALGIMQSMQSIKQARWPTESPLLTLPHFHADMLSAVSNRGQRIESLAELVKLPENVILSLLQRVPGLGRGEVQEIGAVLSNMPSLEIRRRLTSVKSKEGGAREIPFIKGKDEQIETARLEGGAKYELKIEARRLKPFRGKVIV
jgi:hypothetical protein